MRTPLVLICLELLLSVPLLAQQRKHSTSNTENAELARLFKEDQADRSSAEGRKIDWSLIAARDEARAKRVKTLQGAGKLKAAKDYYHAGMILQHGRKPERYLRCHEFCVTAVFLAGKSQPDWLPNAKWLAAASLDRFLVSIKRGQRFATQFGARGWNPQWRLDPIEEGVSDAMRKIWNVPTMAEAKRSEQLMNQ